MSEADSTDGNSFDGRIWVRDQDREWVNDHKKGGETQADVLERLIEFYEEHDPDAESDPVDADELAERVSDRTADKVLAQLR